MIILHDVADILLKLNHHLKYKNTVATPYGFFEYSILKSSVRDLTISFLNQF